MFIMPEENINLFLQWP